MTDNAGSWFVELTNQGNAYGPQSGDDQRQDCDDVHGRSPVAPAGNQTQRTSYGREAIEASGLNYRVELKSLSHHGRNGRPAAKGSRSLSDTGDVLGVVGKQLYPVQYYQAFGFLDAIVADWGTPLPHGRSPGQR